MTTKARQKDKKSTARGVFVVATNSDYAKLCVRSLKRLPTTANVRLLPFTKLKQNRRSPFRAESTVVVSRLSDISKEVLEIATAGAETKQLVFVEELPVEAMAARLMPLSIRNPNRIHIASERNHTSIEQLIYRLVSGLAEKNGSHPIVDAWIETDKLVLLSPTFARLEIPLEKLARFIGTERSEIAAFEIDEDGRFIHWPHADVHLAWTQLQQIIDPTLIVTSDTKIEEYNKRYGAAIRDMREAHELKQSDIQGITTRQLRRVEHGQLTASKKTLEALAKAHSLSLAEYIDQLAKIVTGLR